MSTPEWVAVARLVRPQGRKGELLCELLTDFPERFSPGATVYLAPPDFEGDPSEASQRTVLSSWRPHGKNEARIVLGFSGVQSIEEAEGLAGMEALVPKSDRYRLPEDEIYVSDLVGCLLYDKGVLAGEVRDVIFPTTADGRRRLPEGTPLLVIVNPSGDEHLVPLVRAWLERLDSPGRRVDMNLPQGLFETEGGA